MKNKRKITDLLSNLKKENPFVLPESYFEEFNNKLKERLDKKKFEKEAKPDLYKISRYSWAIAAAAMITGILFAVKIWIVNPSANELRDNEIAVLLQQEFYDLDEFELEDGINQSYTTIKGPEIIEKDSYKDAIIDYLIDEQIDFETIVSEL